MTAWNNGPFFNISKVNTANMVHFELYTSSSANNLCAVPIRREREESRTQYNNPPTLSIGHGTVYYRLRVTSFFSRLVALFCSSCSCSCSSASCL